MADDRPGVPAHFNPKPSDSPRPLQRPSRPRSGWPGTTPSAQTIGDLRKAAERLDGASERSLRSLVVGVADICEALLAQEKVLEKVSTDLALLHNKLQPILHEMSADREDWRNPMP